MLAIRLKRVGKKKDTSFRLIVQEKGRSIQSGNYVERLGHYDPRVDEFTIDAERVKYWLSQGAQPSDTVHNLLVDEGVIDDEKINVLPQKSPVEVVDSDDTEEEAETPGEEGGESDTTDNEGGDEDSEEKAETTDNSEDGEVEDTEDAAGEDAAENPDKNGDGANDEEEKDTNS